MNSILAAILVGTIPGGVIELPREQAIAQITAACEDGTLLFSQGDCLAVRAYTNSPYTHVGMVIYEPNGTAMVYDSMNGVGVRKMSLTEYLTVQAPDKVQLFHPSRDLTDTEVAELQEYLEGELGRPYAVKHHLTGKRSSGLHCSEYVTDALVSIEWLKVANPPRVSPASLAKGIEAHHIYESGGTFVIPVVLEPIPEPEGICQRVWESTKLCTLQCCSRLSGWILCR